MKLKKFGESLTRTLDVALVVNTVAYYLDKLVGLFSVIFVMLEDYKEVSTISSYSFIIWVYLYLNWCNGNVHT